MLRKHPKRMEKLMLEDLLKAKADSGLEQR